MSIKTAVELAEACKKVATNYKTLYVMGCFGAPMTTANKNRYSDENAYNRKPERTAMIKSASSDTFGFDCVCLIKGLLWGWTGNKNATYGGAKYNTNNVPDIDESVMISKCSDVSADFSNIQVGEVVWMKGHIGVYIGDGLAVESSPKWKNGVQITAVLNIGKKSGYHGRTWTKHGKLPYVEYTKPAVKAEPKRNYYNVKLPVLTQGCKGNDVKALQAVLNARGAALDVDGSFGPATASALKTYQSKNGLEVDTKAGPATWTKLING